MTLTKLSFYVTYFDWASAESIIHSLYRTFAIKHQLKTHKIDVHTPKALKPYVCKHCDLVFDSKFLLTKHMAVHRTKPIINKIKKVNTKVCDQCGNEVPTHGYKDHMQRFHGTENIKCNECTMTFRHERIYLQHYERVHIFVTCEVRVPERTIITLAT